MGAIERKDSFIGYFACQWWFSVFTVCTLLGSRGFTLPIQIIPPQERSSINQYTAAYFHAILNIIADHWLSQQNA